MKKISIIILSLAITATVFAQETSKHEFSINAGGGISTLLYSSNVGVQSNGFGYTFGLGYTFNFSENWAILTGVDLAFYNSSYEAKTLSHSYSIAHSTITPLPLPGSDTRFDVTYEYTNYEENQAATYLNIPIMAQFSTSGENKFYVAAGAKIGIPISSKYKIEGGRLDLTGYSHYTGQPYPGNDYPIPTDPKENYDDGHGFGRSTPTDEADLNFKLSCMLSLEMGAKWKLAERWNLYTGIYFDYGLNNISDTNEKRMVEYKESGNHIYNSAIQSMPANIDGINNMAIGLKIKVSFR